MPLPEVTIFISFFFTFISTFAVQSYNIHCGEWIRVHNTSQFPSDLAVVFFIVWVTDSYLCWALFFLHTEEGSKIPGLRISCDPRKHVSNKLPFLVSPALWKGKAPCGRVIRRWLGWPDGQACRVEWNCRKWVLMVHLIPFDKSGPDPGTVGVNLGPVNRLWLNGEVWSLASLLVQLLFCCWVIWVSFSFSCSII